MLAQFNAFCVIETLNVNHKRQFEQCHISLFRAKLYSMTDGVVNYGLRKRINTCKSVLTLLNSQPSAYCVWNLKRFLQIHLYIFDIENYLENMFRLPFWHGDTHSFKYTLRFVCIFKVNIILICFILVETIISLQPIYVCS